MLINHNFSNETELKETLDFIYARSKEGKSFHGIVEAAFNEITIVTAIHNIKSNKGASTAGLDKKNIDYYLQMPKDQLIALIRKEVGNYRPRPVRRVYIPKANGKKRPLGIPTMMDRIIQECLRIILEPVVEAKFYPHSYGFRPARACKDAINYITKIISICKKNKPIFAIEGDIKGFFDNVNHKILLDKLFKIGIHDKRAILLIKKMLEAGYFEDRTTHKTTQGTPQGGILSPLLANVYLNDFDWTIGRMYQEPTSRLPLKISDRRVLRKKGVIPKYLIRYADDWIILTTTEKEAHRLLHYLKNYFYHRLKLELSEEKTKITNLTQEPAKFLGFNLKAEKPRDIPGKKKRTGNIVGKSYPDREKVKTQVNKICKMVRSLKTCKHESMMATTINEINAVITGIAEYWKTGICRNTFNYIDHKVNECAFVVFRKIYKETYMNHKIPARITCNRKERHQTYNTKTWGIKNSKDWIGITKACFTHSHKVKRFFNQNCTPYTKEGRKLIEKANGKKQALDRPAIYDEETLKQYSEGNRIYNFEYLMNREYAYNRDKGKCRICNNRLTPYDRRCHHIDNSLGMNQINKVPNLAWMHHACHRLIHSNAPVDTMNLPKNVMKKIINLRKKLA